MAAYPGDLPTGSLAYIDYGEVPLVIHARLIVAQLQGSEYMIVTPDQHRYIEDLNNDTNPDTNRIWYGPDTGALPAGVAGRYVYGFGAISAADVARWMAAGRRECEAERASRGLVAPAAAPVAAGGVAAVGAAPAAGGGVDGNIWVLAEMLPGRKIGEQVFPPHGVVASEGWALVRVADGSGNLRPCLVRSLPEDDLASFCEERIGLARISEAVAGEDRTACDDVRTLEVTYGQNGERQRSFRETVKELTQTEFPDFPFAPRTTMEYVRAISSVAESATAQHHVWVHGIPEGDRSAYEDEVLARLLDQAVMYDCLNISNLACMELICRRRQLIAEAHSSSPGAPSYMGAEHFMGQTYKAGGGIVVPTLTDYVSKQMQAQSQILKEKRKMEEAKAKGRGKPPKGAPKSGPQGGAA